MGSLRAFFKSGTVEGQDIQVFSHVIKNNRRPTLKYIISSKLRGGVYNMQNDERIPNLPGAGMQRRIQAVGSNPPVPRHMSGSRQGWGLTA